MARATTGTTARTTTRSSRSIRIATRRSIGQLIQLDSGAYLQTDFRPGTALLLGANASAGGSLHFDDIFEGDSTANDPTSAVLDQIMEGPNRGYWYVVGQNYRVDRRWHINKRLDSLKGPKELPDAAHGDTVNHWTYLARRGYDPADLRGGREGPRALRAERQEGPPRPDSAGAAPHRLRRRREACGTARDRHRGRRDGPAQRYRGRGQQGVRAGGEAPRGVGQPHGTYCRALHAGLE